MRFLASPAAEDVNGQLFIVYGPTVTLVAAPTVEQQFTRGLEAWVAAELGARLEITLLAVIPNARSRPPGLVD